jgi:NADH-quinone oxidoreductase subunit L
MNFVTENTWLIPAIPLFSFLLVGLVIRTFAQRWSGVVATTSIFLSAVLACRLGWEYFQAYGLSTSHPVLVPWSFEWLKYQDLLSVNVGVLVDPLSILLMIVVTVVSTLVHFYSLGYMADDPGNSRYFAFLNLFTFSMLGLVVSPNILQMFVFWELVGASSFLLIGFYYEKPSAVAASKKAFIVTRFADLFFLLGIMLLGYHGFALLSSGQALAGAQAFDFLFLNNPDVSAMLASSGVLTPALILIFIGASGKSAMFPLHVWLPDAMEGPTPVSALIHAATMVVAGVYLVARLFPAFAASPDALNVVMCVGAFTSLFAAVIGCTQDDVKRILAFSTLSQLGYLMLALGVATLEDPLGYTASLFHLFTHAFFKALLFLCAGSVIHAAHSNRIWDMGGLAKKMPITHISFLIAALAIAGIPPLAGFFSKDEILLASLRNGHPLVFGVGMAVAALTAFYMFRLYFVVFRGTPRSEGAKHAHEAPFTMAVPLLILAALSIVAGFVPMDALVGLKPAEGHHGVDLTIAVPAVIVALVGISTAWLLYGSAGTLPERIANSLGGVYRTIRAKFYIDELYLFVTRKVIFRFVAAPIAWFDRNVVDGGVNLSAYCTRTLGAALSRLQTGQVQTSGLWFVAGVVGVVFWMIWMLR